MMFEPMYYSIGDGRIPEDDPRRRWWKKEVSSVEKAMRKALGHEGEYCAACGAFGAEYCFYEGRPLCKGCSRVWDSEPVKEDSNE